MQTLGCTRQISIQIQINDLYIHVINCLEEKVKRKDKKENKKKEKEKSNVEIIS